MDTKFIGEHGIRLDLVGKTSKCEFLNMVLRMQTDSSMEESEMQKKHCDSSCLNNDALREQGVSTSVKTNMYKRSLFYWAKRYSSQLK